MASDQHRIDQAARRYGRTLDGIAARYTNPLTGKRLTGEELIRKTIKGESGGRRDAVSSAGAKGWAQFMPGTRAAVVKQFGVDPYRSPEEAVHALTLHMRGKLGNAKGLEGYNPGGGSKYVSYILGQHVGGSSAQGGARGGGGGRGVEAAPATSASGTPAASAASGFQPGGLAQRMSTVQLEAPQMAPSSGVQIPKGLVPAFYQGVPSSGPPSPPPALDLGAPQGQDVNFGGGPTDQAPTGPSAGAPSSGDAGPAPGGTVKGFKPGVPTAHTTSVGGAHETMGLAGYPAKDYMAPAGSAAVAPVNGTVTRLSGHDPAGGPTNGPHGPLGWSVYIKGSDGRMYFLTHMGSRNVKPGQKVKAGQKIGTVANYNKYGTPSHIHMGVHG